MAFMGSVQQRSTGDGVKAACHYFQRSAGLFEALREYLAERPQEIQGADLADDYLTMMRWMMLAQAQECFYEKATKESMSASLVSKLAAQVADFYCEALALLNSGSDSFKRVDNEWKVHAGMRIKYFLAAAHYRQSLACVPELEYGAQVAHLRAAHALLQGSDTKTLMKKVPAEMKTFTERAASLVASALAKAQKENDMIYHVPVPAELPTLERKAVVRALPFDEANDPSLQLDADDDPFCRLVPFVVHQACSVYEERKAVFVRTVGTQVDEANDLAKTMLCSMQLPGALQAVETPHGLPASLVAKIKALQQQANGSGGVRALRDLFETRAKMRAENHRMLGDAMRALADEERDDDELRARLGDARWTRTPSHQLTAHLVTEAKRYEGHLQVAEKSDALVLAKYKQHEVTLAKLCGPYESILSLLPAPAAASAATHPSVAELKQALKALDELIAAREQLVATLRARVADDDISHLILGCADPHAIIFQRELKKFDELAESISRNVEQQEQLFERIADANSRFVASRQSSDPNLQQRQEALQRIDIALRVHPELLANLNEGIQFYATLQDMLGKFKNKCADFVFARRTEKHDLMEQLQANAQQYVQQQPSSSQMYATQAYAPAPYAATAAPPPVFMYSPQSPQSPQAYASSSSSVGAAPAQGYGAPPAQYVYAPAANGSAPPIYMPPQNQSQPSQQRWQ
jgi:programmed cell death 6-interacting protein